MAYNTQYHQCCPWRPCLCFSFSLFTVNLHRRDSHTRGKWICCNMSSGAVVKSGRGHMCVCVCGCLSEHVRVEEGVRWRWCVAHVCVWRAGVDTDTAAPLSSSIPSQDVWGTPHRLAPSNLCWNQKPCGWKASALEDAVSTRTREAQAGRIAGKVTVENYGEVNYTLLMSCFKIAGRKKTHGITLNPPSNPLI